jgi:hypothetical protein
MDGRIVRAFDALNQLAVANPQIRGPVAERLAVLVHELNHPGQARACSNATGGTRNTGNQERCRVAARLGSFHSKSSTAWAEIVKRFGDGLNQTELLSIAQVLGWMLDIRVDREAKRRKEVLVKWFDEHWSAISDTVNLIRLEDIHGRPIIGSGGDRPGDPHMFCP